MFWSHKNLVCGAIFAVAIPLIYPAHRELLNLDDPVTGLTYLLILTALGFASGSYFWVMLCIARMFLSLGKEVKIKPSIFDGKTSVLRGASAIIFKVSVVSALIYVLGLTTVRVCHLGYDVISGAVTAGFGLFIVVYFVLSQWNIHKSLEEIKQARLNALVEKIDPDLRPGGQRRLRGGDQAFARTCCICRGWSTASKPGRSAPIIC